LDALFGSKVIGTDDTGVKVLDPKLPFARTGRIWPYLGDAHHPVVVHHYTPTRGRDGRARFLEPACGLIEVECMMHMRRYFLSGTVSNVGRLNTPLCEQHHCKGVFTPHELASRK